MSESLPTQGGQTFYRVEEQGRPPDECQCANCKLWTVVYDEGEPTEIGTAYQGDAGKEAAEDVCDLMNMAFDAGQESRQATIKGLCDRIESINKLTRPRPQAMPYNALRAIEEISAGFMEVPK